MPNRGAVTALVAAALVALAQACTDRNLVEPPKSSPAVPIARADYYNPNCGASYTMITDDYDDVMAQYGIGTTVDTANVCETWTGSDYTMHAAVVGSSEFVGATTDVVQGTDYHNGTVTPYSAAGSVTGPTDGTPGSTAFDLMQADAALRQASYDDPYYGIRSPGGCTPPCAAQSLSATATRADKSVSTTPGTGRRSVGSNDVRQFGQHGISRLGVRALVDDATEVGRTKAGHRRFQKNNGKDLTTYILDKDTELLIGEEHADSVSTMTVSHSWNLVNGVYVRDRTEIRSTERVRGHDRTSHTTITFTNVHLSPSALVPANAKVTP